MFSKSTPFDKALEKATSQLLLDVDWDAVLQICDFIRQEDVQPKIALAAIKRKISSENPHVSMFALQTLESVVKNCGSIIHKEIATKEFMEYVKDQCKVRTDPVKTKVLELIQIWSHAFRNETSYRIVLDTFNLMKVEGYTFPAMKEADAMFTAESAPEWREGDVCARCRTTFSVMNRKHHCRHCGDVFCGKCSTKASIIPKFGIEKEVRVCESCFDTLNPSSAPKKDDVLPAEYLASPLSKQSQAPPTKTEQELKEKEELELALALSQSEQESKQKNKKSQLYNTSYNMAGPSNAPQATDSPVDTSQIDPELAHYLNRNYWDQRSDGTKTSTTQVSATTTPSAPAANTDPTYAPLKIQEAYQNGETDTEEQFLNALVGSVEIFVNRMKSNSMRGRSIANDTAVQSLFTAISNMHPQLMTYLQQQEDVRGNYETLQDKLAQLRDAREALDALREDHREKKRREFEEMERRRQIQMAHKLEIMRQKKHEYLEAQRQHALQKLQEQEREMQARFEKQKQLTQMRQMQAYGYPQQLYNQAMGQVPDPNMMGQQQTPGYIPQTGPPPPGGMPQQGPGMPPQGQPGQSVMGQPGMGQSGMGQPGQPGMGQPGMGQPSMGPQGAPQPVPDGSNTSMHSGSQTNIQYQPPMGPQPGMTVPGQPINQAPGQPTTQGIPSGVTGPPGAPIPANMQQYPMQGYPQYNPPGQPGYQPVGQPYNMQGMASNLPNQPGYAPQQPPPQQPGYTPAPQDQNQQGAPVNQGQPPQGQGQENYSTQQVNQNAQPRPSHDVQLISFD